MKKQPNILLIMTDQHRFDYLNCAGGTFLNTPNIDRLAKRGMHFTNCYTNCPVCAPARIGLATGLQPSRMGAMDNASYLPLNTPTYYQKLRNHGYRVGCVGKLDLAKPSGYNGRNGDRPCVYGWGFTHPKECEGKMHAGRGDSPKGPYGYYLEQKGLFESFHEDYINRRANGWTTKASHDSVLSTEDFEDSYIGRRASKWIKEIPNDFPWHLFVSFVGPHDPYDPPTEYANKYRNIKMPEPITDDGNDKPDWIKQRQTANNLSEIMHTRRQYCGSIELIDNQIGKILNALEERGEADNTYIIFTSDHGDMLGDHGIYQKCVPYEAAIHVPLIVVGPNIRNGTSGALIELIDLNPTMCMLAGVSPTIEMDARDFIDILFGEKETHRENVVSRMNNFRCIRTDRYKYIENYNSFSELYDLENDPFELINIAKDNIDIVKSLSKQLNNRYMEGKWLW